ncbi:MAG: flagellar basal body rod protein FlgC [Deltaproteobacteria bacterium]|nr:flagellar basal body rod protein FlgC [Deltaproteobacteria bacterium]
MNFFGMMDIAASGLAAQRLRMETIASNLANANATRTAEGGPYRRRDVIFAAESVAGPFREALDGHLRQVQVRAIVEDPSPARLRYEPGHPDADSQGYVAYPNVDAVAEMVNLLSATRSYEANLTVMDAAKNLMLRALEI